MDDKELFDIVHQLYENGRKTWNDVASKMSGITGIDRSAGAWRLWHKYRLDNPDLLHRSAVKKPSNTQLTDDVGPHLDATDDQDLIEKVWASTNLSQSEWEIGKVKAWGSFGNYKFATEFTRKALPIDMVAAVKDALGPVDWSGVKVADKKGTYLFVPGLFDAHIGKLGNNVPDEAFELTLEQMILDAERVGEIGEVLFILGHDFGHIDNTQYTTTGGTPQEVDSTYHDIIRRQRTIALKCIRRLAEDYFVNILMAPGNHDRFSNMWLGELVSAVFEDHPNVTVDNSDNPRKYFQWGNLTLMTTHGRDEKMNNIGNVVATEARKMWGETERCEVLVGDIHTRREIVSMIDEKNGVLIRYFPSLSGTDTWHMLKTYTGNSRGGLALLYSNEYGCKATISVSLDEVMAKYGG